MTNLLLDILTGTAVVIGTLGQLADSWTTYDGLYVKRVPGVVEGDSSATWITKNRFLCLAFKPGVFLLSGLALVIAGPYTDGGGYAMAAVFSVMAAFVGFTQGFENAKINGGWGL
jgi:hypothetical protein